MQFDAIAPYLTETHFKITKVLDGDSFIVQNIFSKKQKEIRLYGLDAPENKRNRKLLEDEKKARVAGEFLIQLGMKATAFALTIAPPETNITLITEEKYFFDFYKRQLAYIILPDGSCLNEILIEEGYAKSMSEYYCSNLAKYQQLNFAAMQSGKGLYAFVSNF
jgi:micrococcal nuclease